MGMTPLERAKQRRKTCQTCESRKVINGASYCERDGKLLHPMLLENLGPCPNEQYGLVKAQLLGLAPVPIIHSDCDATNEADARRMLGIDPEEDRLTMNDNDLILRAEAIAEIAEYAIQELKALPAVDAVPVVRCKDCKHRPTDNRERDNDMTGFAIEFPDSLCPCQCEDGWYNWYPTDDWFCGNGERRDDDGTADRR